MRIVLTEWNDWIEEAIQFGVIPEFIPPVSYEDVTNPECRRIVAHYFAEHNHNDMRFLERAIHILEYSHTLTEDGQAKHIWDLERLGMYYAYANRYDEAMAILDEALLLAESEQTTFTYTHPGRIWAEKLEIYVDMGRKEDAYKAIKDMFHKIKTCNETYCSNSYYFYGNVFLAHIEASEENYESACERLITALESLPMGCFSPYELSDWNEVKNNNTMSQQDRYNKLNNLCNHEYEFEK